MFAAGSGIPMAKGAAGADALGAADDVEFGAASLLQALVTASAAAPRRNKL
jgi:hypothetical protein